MGLRFTLLIFGIAILIVPFVLFCVIGVAVGKGLATMPGDIVVMGFDGAKKKKKI